MGWRLSLNPFLCSSRGCFQVCLSAACLLVFGIRLGWLVGGFRSLVSDLCVLELDYKVISKLFLDVPIIKTCSSGSPISPGLKVS